MTSSLTGSSLKSGYLYVVLLLGVFLGGVYFIFFKQPNVIDNLNQQAFRLNYAAFRSGIKSAHLKFLANKLNLTGSGIDIWRIEGAGLDYNHRGFPIGSSIENPQLTMPISAEHCRQIWQFVLNPMQQDIGLAAGGSDYWTQLTSEQQCEYRSSQFEFMWILYDPSNGQVTLQQDAQ